MPPKAREVETEVLEELPEEGFEEESLEAEEPGTATPVATVPHKRTRDAATLAAAQKKALAVVAKYGLPKSIPIAIGRGKMTATPRGLVVVNKKEKQNSVQYRCNAGADKSHNGFKYMVSVMISMWKPTPQGSRGGTKINIFGT